MHLDVSRDANREAGALHLTTAMAVGRDGASARSTGRRERDVDQAESK